MMGDKTNLTLNIKGDLINFDTPKVMGILNVTPDSFFSQSRTDSETLIRDRIKILLEEGVDIIDVGGCSTRPGFEAPLEEEEWQRVELGCRVAKELCPQIPLSVDTFRAGVAQKALEHWKVDIINDVSGGKDPYMWKVVADYKAGYVLTHNRDSGSVDYTDVTANVITELSWKLNELYRLGVGDVIIDPGFGFAKTLDQNFQLLADLEEFSYIGVPILVGFSRKSMIYKILGCTPEESLTGTIALNAVALAKGADILRVHDVKEAKETVKLISKLRHD